MDDFLPSEVARLVLGYLKDVNCMRSWEIFLEENCSLHEYYLLHKHGKVYSTDVDDKSLLEILSFYRYLKKYGEKIVNEIKLCEKVYSCNADTRKDILDEILNMVSLVFQKYILLSNELASSVPISCVTPEVISSPSESNIFDDCENKSNFTNNLPGNVIQTDNIKNSNSTVTPKNFDGASKLPTISAVYSLSDVTATSPFGDISDVNISKIEGYNDFSENDHFMDSSKNKYPEITQVSNVEADNNNTKDIASAVTNESQICNKTNKNLVMPTNKSLRDTFERYESDSVKVPTSSADIEIKSVHNNDMLLPTLLNNCDVKSSVKVTSDLKSENYPVTSSKNNEISSDNFSQNCPLVSTIKVDGDNNLDVYLPFLYGNQNVLQEGCNFDNNIANLKDEFLSVTTANSYQLTTMNTLPVSVLSSHIPTGDALILNTVPCSYTVNAPFKILPSPVSDTVQNNDIASIGNKMHHKTNTVLISDNKFDCNTFERNESDSVKALSSFADIAVKSVNTNATLVPTVSDCYNVGGSVKVTSDLKSENCPLKNIADNSSPKCLLGSTIKVDCDSNLNLNLPFPYTNQNIAQEMCNFENNTSILNDVFTLPFSAVPSYILTGDTLMPNIVPCSYMSAPFRTLSLSPVFKNVQNTDIATIDFSKLEKNMLSHPVSKEDVLAAFNEESDNKSSDEKVCFNKDQSSINKLEKKKEKRSKHKKSSKRKKCERVSSAIDKCNYSKSRHKKNLFFMPFYMSNERKEMQKGIVVKTESNALQLLSLTTGENEENDCNRLVPESENKVKVESQVISLKNKNMTSTIKLKESDILKSNKLNESLKNKNINNNVSNNNKLKFIVEKDESFENHLMLQADTENHRNSNIFNTQDHIFPVFKSSKEKLEQVTKVDKEINKKTLKQVCTIPVFDKKSHEQKTVAQYCKEIKKTTSKNQPKFKKILPKGSEKLMQHKTVAQYCKEIKIMTSKDQSKLKKTLPKSSEKHTEHKHGVSQKEETCKLLESKLLKTDAESKKLKSPSDDKEVLHLNVSLGEVVRDSVKQNFKKSKSNKYLFNENSNINKNEKSFESFIKYEKFNNTFKSEDSNTQEKKFDVEQKNSVPILEDRRTEILCNAAKVCKIKKVSDISHGSKLSSFELSSNDQESNTSGAQLSSAKLILKTENKSTSDELSSEVFSSSAQTKDLVIQTQHITKENIVNSTCDKENSKYAKKTCPSPHAFIKNKNCSKELSRCNKTKPTKYSAVVANPHNFCKSNKDLTNTAQKLSISSYGQHTKIKKTCNMPKYFLSNMNQDVHHNASVKKKRKSKHLCDINDQLDHKVSQFSNSSSSQKAKKLNCDKTPASSDSDLHTKIKKTCNMSKYFSSNMNQDVPHNAAVKRKRKSKHLCDINDQLDHKVSQFSNSSSSGKAKKLNCDKTSPSSDSNFPVLPQSSLKKTKSRKNSNSKQSFYSSFTEQSMDQTVLRTNIWSLNCMYTDIKLRNAKKSHCDKATLEPNSDFESEPFDLLPQSNLKRKRTTISQKNCNNKQIFHELSFTEKPVNQVAVEENILSMNCMYTDIKLRNAKKLHFDKAHLSSNSDFDMPIEFDRTIISQKNLNDKQSFHELSFAKKSVDQAVEENTLNLNCMYTDIKLRNVKKLRCNNVHRSSNSDFDLPIEFDRSTISQKHCNDKQAFHELSFTERSVDQADGEENTLSPNCMYTDIKLRNAKKLHHDKASLGSNSDFDLPVEFDRITISQKNCNNNKNSHELSFTEKSMDQAVVEENTLSLNCMYSNIKLRNAKKLNYDKAYLSSNSDFDLFSQSSLKRKKTTISDKNCDNQQNSSFIDKSVDQAIVRENIVGHNSMYKDIKLQNAPFVKLEKLDEHQITALISNLDHNMEKELANCRNELDQTSKAVSEGNWKNLNQSSSESILSCNLNPPIHDFNNICDGKNTVGTGMERSCEKESELPFSFTSCEKQLIVPQSTNSYYLSKNVCADDTVPIKDAFFIEKGPSTNPTGSSKKECNRTNEMFPPQWDLIQSVIEKYGCDYILSKIDKFLDC